MIFLPHGTNFAFTKNARTHYAYRNYMSISERLDRRVRT
jgi:hypothetical protein